MDDTLELKKVKTLLETTMVHLRVTLNLTWLCPFEKKGSWVSHPVDGINIWLYICQRLKNTKVRDLDFCAWWQRNLPVVRF